MNRRRGLLAAVILVAALILVSGTLLIASAFLGWPVGSGAGPFRGSLGRFGTEFTSNGERIYFTGTSETGPPITAQMPGMHRMARGMEACANCHGPNGEGGTVRMMMTTATAPNIQYDNLVSGEHGHEDEEDVAGEEHPAYTDETIARAITQGVDPSGEPLEWMMPRWEMTEAQLADLIAFLKTLD
jgi:cytochrome c oxidase subunit II